ncbi:unnamed protein product [Parascedosporium putredinis]|uniref:Ras-domain-containing protein n=1 Tax=Parascedosporium putredinis TaxID=1442378 RepID=A0A9P1M752_9PEZI|nr:unnamed protein product [Parascedosporium putredinis]CAI7988002.1 unnamed protein product [Parascedosporium putredinis]
MGREEYPKARILLLGAPGSGKNCLESRFTTMTFPPPYNPALTLSSRRLFTLTSRGSQPSTPSVQSTLSLRPSLGDSREQGFPETPRPQTGSSTYSRESAPGVVSIPGPADLTATHSGSQGGTDGCAECIRTANTFMIEVINYPGLELAKERANVLSAGDYDAVLLVYDRSRLDGPAKREKGEPENPARFPKEGPIVALAGNKADVDSAPSRHGLRLTSPRARRREIQPAEPEQASGSGSNSSEPRGEIPRSASSLSMTMREFVADGRRSAMSMESSIVRTPSKLLKRKSSQSRRLAPQIALAARQTAEGETLARELQVQIPFLETSAKSGDNVEELFEAILREILASKGHRVRESVLPRDSTPCKRHAAMDSKFNSAANSPTNVIPEGRLAIHHAYNQHGTRSSGEWPSAFVRERSPEASDLNTEPNSPPVVAKPKKEGMLRRMSSIFGRRKPVERIST